jgi:hypothetical protein
MFNSLSNILKIFQNAGCMDRVNPAKQAGRNMAYPLSPD